MAEKIPQNIDKEDKLVGPLTLKQFLYMLGGAALSFVAYQYYIRGYLFFGEFLIIALLLMGFASALAFFKINGRPFVIFLWISVKYLFSTKRHLWNRDNQAIAKPIKMRKSTSPKKAPKAGSANRGQLEKLAHILDTGGRMDTDESPETHEINTLELKKRDSQIPETNLAVEDILSETDL